MNELHGEKIDIVDYSDDPAGFVANALSPARVSRVHVIDAQAREAQVIVPDYQLSLAIGKEGQNARLAARLTGWRIDIRPDAAGPSAGTSAGSDARDDSPAPASRSEPEIPETSADSSVQSSGQSVPSAAPDPVDPSMRFSPGVPDAQTR